MAIIAILAAIMFPMFVKTRDKAKQTVCVANLYQIGKAFYMYAADHADKVPKEFDGNPQTGFDELLNPYVKTKKIWKCPKNRSKGIDSFSPPDQTTPRHYAMVSEQTRTGYPFSRYRAPSETILLAEIYGKGTDNKPRAEHVILPLPDQMVTYTTPPSHPSQGNLYWDIHDGMSNYLMFDTHVKAMKWEHTVRPHNMWTMNPND
jgi:prepilin-type processing-associated H-X9-DG protein